jgi:hypothetical protein
MPQPQKIVLFRKKIWLVAVVSTMVLCRYIGIEGMAIVSVLAVTLQKTGRMRLTLPV